MNDDSTDFEGIADDMRSLHMKLPQQRLQIAIPDARNVLSGALSYFLSIENKKLQWLPEYDEVADWLSSNQGRGLFMYGNCGRGKTLIGQYVLPALLLKYYNKITSTYNVQEMNANLDLVLKKHIISLDDIGTEEVSNNFGNKRMAFAEIMDAAEKEGKLIIASSNLDAADISSRYGDRVLDRIVACTRRIAFNGKSLRW
ncbi:MAG: hypothetical protein ACK5MK_12610 [Dysgonomonas sp.]